MPNVSAEQMTELKKMFILDEIADDAGGYVSPGGDNKVHYDYRAILKYCKDNNKEPMDLTVRELQKFIIH